jgi:hypothetical protein
MNDKRDIWILVCTIVCLILICLLGNECSKSKRLSDKYLINNILPDGTKETITKTEHIYHTDTIFKVKHIEISKPVLLTTHDTFIKPVYVDTNNCRRIYVYKDSLVDSNIVFYYTDYIQGIIRDKKMSYKLKVPIRIVDSILIKDKIYPQFQLSVGMEAGLNMFSPLINISYKKGGLLVGYNLITKTPQIGFTYKLIQK